MWDSWPDNFIISTERWSLGSVAIHGGGEVKIILIVGSEREFQLRGMEGGQKKFGIILIVGEREVKSAIDTCPQNKPNFNL